MGARYLIDTNVVIDFSANRIPKSGIELITDCLNDDPQISIITKIELLGFSFVTPAIKEFVKSSNVIGLSDDIVDKTILIRKQHKIKLPDAIIAATAIVSGLILLSRNTIDFKNIKGLNHLNLFQLS
jgi:predicted nucleic acid-binding protein